VDDPFDDLPGDDTPARPYPVSALMLGAALAARCEDCAGLVFRNEEEDARSWLEWEPFDLPRFCADCEARRDVLGIPLDRPGPIPADELRRLYQEPRETGG